MEITKNCVMCSAEYVTRGKRARFCPACRILRQREQSRRNSQARREKARQENTTAIARAKEKTKREQRIDINAEAKKSGMSYGKYVGLKKL